MTTFNKLSDPPTANSRDMRAYMQAILETTGLMAGQSFPLEYFMSNYRTHLTEKTNFNYPTLQKNSDGTYELTPEGYNFFQSRLTSDPILAGQKVSRSEVVEMSRNILASEPHIGWESFDVVLDDNA